MRLTTLTLSLSLVILVGCDSTGEESDDGWDSDDGWGSEAISDEGTGDVDEGAEDDGGLTDGGAEVGDDGTTGSDDGDTDDGTIDAGGSTDDASGADADADADADTDSDDTGSVSTEADVDADSGHVASDDTGDFGTGSDTGESITTDPFEDDTVEDGSSTDTGEVELEEVPEDTGIATDEPTSDTGISEVGISDDYPAVGRLTFAPTTLDARCTGTLIGAEWVLTTGMCANSIETIYAAYPMYFVLGDAPSGSETVAVLDAIPHPLYSSLSPILRYDIGLVRLETPVFGIEPLLLNMESLSFAWIGETVTHIGFGGPSEGTAFFGGLRRIFDYPLDDYDSSIVYTFNAGEPHFACGGDSGGALLYEDRVMGVISFGYDPVASVDTPSGCWGSGIGSIRVDAHIDWLTATTGLAF